MVAIGLLLTIIAFLALDYFVFQRVESGETRRPAGIAGIPAPVRVGEGADLDLLPANVFLGPGHVWVRLERSGSIRVGADGLACALLGSPDRVEVTPAGRTVQRGDQVAVLQSGERTLRLLAPTDGVVSRVNPRLAVKPSYAGKEPYDAGWLCELRPSRLAGALKGMRAAEEATAWMRAELGELRDVVTGWANRRRPGLEAMADGGLPIRALAQRLDDREWHMLRARFFEGRLSKGPSLD
jgi:glycine cleavage system H protein